MFKQRQENTGINNTIVNYKCILDLVISNKDSILNIFQHIPNVLYYTCFINKFLNV